MIGELRAVVGAAACAFLLVGCDSQPQQPKNAEPDTLKLIKADEELMAAPETALPILKTRLAAAVNVSDGVIVVHSPNEHSFLMHVLPLSTPWMINCGVGVDIVFGAAVSGDRDEVKNDLEVPLALGIVNQKVCDEVAPELGRTLVTMMHTGHIGQ